MDTVDSWQISSTNIFFHHRLFWKKIILFFYYFFQISQKCFSGKCFFFCSSDRPFATGSSTCPDWEAWKVRWGPLEDHLWWVVTYISKPYLAIEVQNSFVAILALRSNEVHTLNWLEYCWGKSGGRCYKTSNLNRDDMCHWVTNALTHPSSSWNLELDVTLSFPAKYHLSTKC